jgi:alpha-ketoglutarate-dependent taurine dioxygenase
MNKTKFDTANTPNFNKIKRRSVAVSQTTLVETTTLADKPIPLVIQPITSDVNLISWANNNREWIESLLWQHNALLFRNFKVKGISDFSQFLQATSDGELLEYRDRSTPRQEKGNHIYTSTEHPCEQRINLHNEGTYWVKWALKLYFCCLQVAEQGGETPIANVQNVYDRIAPEIRAKFAEKQMMLVRNYNDGFGLSWQNVYQTQDKGEVEEYCYNHQIKFEWKAGDRLRTYQIRPAIRQHPKTGKLSWFNHVAFFHYTTLDPIIRNALLSEFYEDGLPYNTYYGDGSPIEPEVVEMIRQAYAKETVIFPWQAGDILLLDNMAIAHGREPYVGERQVIVAMTEPFSNPDL